MTNIRPSRPSPLMIRFLNAPVHAITLTLLSLNVIFSIVNITLYDIGNMKSYKETRRSYGR
ncbi:hypothetical protein FAM22280_00311 [Lacticaseibacillus paracasei]|nr:hypothetical protein FAM22280_00311 [Lacticaseibacillus paracasei]